MIKTHEGKFATRLMCRVLQVSSSGCYDGVAAARAPQRGHAPNWTSK